jgi:hypothetical protein
MYDKPRPFQGKYGRKIPFTNHKLEAPKKKIKKRRGPSVRCF